MNQILETIKNRRSARRYAPQPLAQEHLDAILEAAVWAPSAHNDQGWHFTVVRNKELIDALSEDIKAALVNSPLEWAAAMGRNAHFHVFYGAPAVVVVSGRKDALSPLVDCSAAIQNMLLAAESVGAGSCWIGFCRWLFALPEAHEKWAQKLNVPPGHAMNFCVALGYKTGLSPKPPARREATVNYID